MLIVYKTTCLINDKIYVGQLSRNDSKYLGSGPLIQEAIKEFGSENFIRETICECENYSELCNMEDYWIDFLHATDPEIGYNIINGHSCGCLLYYKENNIERYNEIIEKMRNKIVTPDSIEKRANSNRGQKRTPEQCLNMKSAQQNRPIVTDETKEKMSLAKLGTKKSEDTKEKMSISAKNKPPMTEKTKELLSIANSGENNSNYGKHLSEVQKQKISESMKGKNIGPKSEQAKQKMKKPKSEEHKKNISLALKGKIPWNKNKPWSEARRKSFEDKKIINL